MNDKADLTPSDDVGDRGRPVRGKRRKRGLLTRLRNYFLTGIIVTAAIGITAWLIWLFVDFVDGSVLPLLPEKYSPETYLGWGVPGLGVIIMLVGLTLIGAIFTGFVGRALVRTGERIVARMPVVRHVYGALKQIFEAVLTQSSEAFREVVLVEYPRRGLWVLGFVTSPTKGEVKRVIEAETANVFIPTTPNPTSGFLLFVPRQDLIKLDMKVEEGVKLVISGGIVSPPDPGSDKIAEIPKRSAEGRRKG